MATIEERLTALEQEHATLREKIELQTIAIGALVNKAMLEKINEKNDKIFQALMAHDELINRQLAELREKIEVDVEGKIVGMQTEMRQGFKDTATKDDLSAMNVRFDEQDKKFDQIMLLLNTLTNKP